MFTFHIVLNTSTIYVCHIGEESYVLGATSSRLVLGFHTYDVAHTFYMLLNAITLSISSLLFSQLMYFQNKVDHPLWPCFVVFFGDGVSGLNRQYNKFFQ